jgi:hypothetical protein
LAEISDTEMTRRLSDDDNDEEAPDVPLNWVDDL